MMIRVHLFHNKYLTNRLHFPCLCVDCNWITDDVGACKELNIQHQTIVRIVYIIASIKHLHPIFI